MDAHALSKMFSSQAVNRKAKAKRRVRKKKSKHCDKPPHPPRDVFGFAADYEKPIFAARRNLKIGSYYEHKLDDVSDGDPDEDNGKYVPIELANGETRTFHLSYPDDDKMLEIYYYTDVCGELKGLSDALVAESFEFGTKDHKKRFKRVPDWQIPHEEKLQMQCPSVKKYHSTFLMTAICQVLMK